MQTNAISSVRTSTDDGVLFVQLLNLLGRSRTSVAASDALQKNMQTLWIGLVLLGIVAVAICADADVAPIVRIII